MINHAEYVNDYILLDKEDEIMYVTLNRPQSYNSLSKGMLMALSSVFADLAKTTSVRVIILQGAGKGFCAGHDIKEIEENAEQKFYEELLKICSQFMLQMMKMPQIIIAKVHGAAVAAGCQLICSCDLVVAADTAKFSTPGVNIGLFCSTPMVALSRNVARKQTMEMLLLGESVMAPQALEIGLINRCVQETELSSITKEMALKIISKPPVTVMNGKKTFYEQLSLSETEAYETCSQAMMENLLHREAQENIKKFLNK